MKVKSCSATLPSVYIRPEMRQKLICQMQKDINNLPRDLVPSVDYFRKHKDIVDKLKEAAKNVDKRFSRYLR